MKEDKKGEVTGDNLKPRYQPIKKNRRILVILLVFIIIIGLTAVAVTSAMGGDNVSGSDSTKILDLSELTQKTRTPETWYSDIEVSGTEPIKGPLGYIVIRKGQGEATQTITYTNTCESMVHGLLSAITVNGDIQVTQGSGDKYSVEIELYAEGECPDDARTHLEEMGVEFTDKGFYDNNDKLLGVAIDVEINFQENVDYQQSGTIKITVPATAYYGLKLDTVNGNVQTSSLELVNADISTVNGNVQIESPCLYPGEYFLETTNGNAQVIINTFKNGEFKIDFSTVNGNAQLQVPGDDKCGYDVKCTTVNGNIKIDLPNVETLEDENTNKHVRTRGFSDKSVQITSKLETTNGNVDVN